jgi:hypothetical protein
VIRINELFPEKISLSVTGAVLLLHAAVLLLPLTPDWDLPAAHRPPLHIRRAGLGPAGDPSEIQALLSPTLFAQPGPYGFSRDFLANTSIRRKLQLDPAPDPLRPLDRTRQIQNPSGFLSPPIPAIRTESTDPLPRRYYVRTALSGNPPPLSGVHTTPELARSLDGLNELARFSAELKPGESLKFFLQTGADGRVEHLFLLPGETRTAPPSPSLIRTLYTLPARPGNPVSGQLEIHATPPKEKTP